MKLEKVYLSEGIQSRVKVLANLKEKDMQSLLVFCRFLGKLLKNQSGKSSVREIPSLTESICENFRPLFSS